MKILAIFGTIALGAILILVGAGGALWLNRLRPAAAPPRVAVTSTPTAASASSATAVRTRTAIDRADIEQLLVLADPQRRTQILESADSFKEFVQQEAANQSVVRAAVANAADRNPVVAEVMERAGLRVLAQAYLNQVIQNNLGAEFPSEQQIREYFDANQERFRTPDRVHVWQIFFSVASDAAATDVAAAETTANRVALALKQGQTDFAAEAARSSGHLQSRLSDGYMGLLNVRDLLPEIRSEVDALAENAVSKPVRSATGFHIIKRGALVQGQPLRLEDVTGQVRQMMRQQAEDNVRKAAVDKIIESYPTTFDADAVPGWRETLLKTSKALAPDRADKAAPADP